MSGALTKEEVNRKLLHVLALVLPVGIFYGPQFFQVERIWLCVLAVGLTCFSIFVELVRLRHQAFGKWFLLLSTTLEKGGKAKGYRSHLFNFRSSNL